MGGEPCPTKKVNDLVEAVYETLAASMTAVYELSDYIQNLAFEVERLREEKKTWHQS